MKILVAGSGGREHALAWKLKQSPRVTALYCAPGNAGAAALGTNVPIAASDLNGLAKFVETERIDFTVVGPDDPLAAGIVDLFHERGLRIFGPNRSGALLEASKIFAKQFMERHGIPTARSGQFSESGEAQLFCQKMRFPVVIKADGLALGKGVVIAPDPDTAAKAIYRMMEQGQFGPAGKRIVIEEFLSGKECSIHALIDGRHFLLFPGSQDYKRAFDGDQGPNTGGMGTFSPSPLFTPELRETVTSAVLEPFLRGIAQESLGYHGMLYPGLMITPEGGRVLEFNARFGDPETQVLLPRLKSDLLDLLEAAVDGTLDRVVPVWDDRAAVCVVLVSGGYPGAYSTGKEISGLDSFAGHPDIHLFHAGTRLEGNRVVTAGGRVLGVTALGKDLAAARELAYEAAGAIHFEGVRFRGDIAMQALD